MNIAQPNAARSGGSGAAASSTLERPRFDPAVGDRPEIAVEPPRRGQDDEQRFWERWRLVIAAAGCWLFLIAGLVVDHLTPLPHGVAIGLFVLAYLSGGTFATIGALEDLFRHRTVNVDLLMVTAAIGAAIVNSWPEGAILLGLFSASGALEHEALGRTQRAVRALMELSPDVATVVRDGIEQTVPVETLCLGEGCLVRPGGRVPVDGVVVSGETTIDQSAITGESIPVGKRPGDRVFAGTINGYGAIQVRVDRLSQESTLAKIVQFVEDAQAQKSRTQRFTDRFEGRYAVGVLVASALLAIVPPLFFGHEWSSAFYQAMTLLVVASPCALVISTPASTLSALANAARHGILFKGSAYLEEMGVVQTVAFDKTGTLTHGHPTLTDVVALPGGWSEDETLQLAASAEHLSEHHLASAIVRAAGERGLPLLEAQAFQAIPSRGVVARVDGRDVAIGNIALFTDLGGSVSDEAQAAANRLRAEGKSAVFVGDRIGARGVIAVADTLRASAPAVVADLKALGVGRTVMLTGDHQRVADAIASRLDIDDVYADLLPEDKLVIIRNLMSDGSTAMVGDGVNDAPALATATIGVAMGGAGTDVALETADVVLMADDLTRLPYAVELSRKTRRTIRQNLTFALIVIAVLVTAALTIGIPLPLGVVGHEGSTVIVVLNGLRLLRPLSERTAAGAR